MCGVRHRSGKQVSWANLDAGDQLGSSDSLHLPSHKLESHVSVWAESQHHREVSCNLEDDEQGGRRLILRSRKAKKEDRRRAQEMAKKGKVGGDEAHLTPVTP